MKKNIIPNRFLLADYEKDVLPTLKETVDDFRKTRKGLFLYGGAGVGKTHTAYAICKKMSLEGMTFQAFKAIDILKMAREDMNFESRNGDFDTNGDIYFGSSTSFGSNHINFLDGINNFKGFLFIDDLGTEKSTEWVLETFYSIIDKKYEDMIPILITSNFNLDEISKKIGDKMASRIVEMCRVYEMTGGDKRLSQK